MDNKNKTNSINTLNTPDDFYILDIFDKKIKNIDNSVIGLLSKCLFNSSNSKFLSKFKSNVTTYKQILSIMIEAEAKYLVLNLAENKISLTTVIDNYDHADRILNTIILNNLTKEFIDKDTLNSNDYAKAKIKALLSDKYVETNKNLSNYIKDAYASFSNQEKYIKSRLIELTYPNLYNNIYLDTKETINTNLLNNKKLKGINGFDSDYVGMKYFLDYIEKSKDLANFLSTDDNKRNEIQEFINKLKNIAIEKEINDEVIKILDTIPVELADFYNIFSNSVNKIILSTMLYCSIN